MAPALPLLPRCSPAQQETISRSSAQQAAADGQQILVLRPGRFEDGQRAIEAVRSGRSVVLNASDLDPMLGQRLVDFTCGGITAMDGHSHRLGEAVFLFTPLMAKIESVEPGL